MILSAPTTTLFTLLRQTGNKMNTFAVSISFSSLRFLSFPSRYKIGRYKYLHNKLHSKKFDEMCFLCAFVIRSDQEYQIKRREGTVDKIQFKMLQGVAKRLMIQ